MDEQDKLLGTASAVVREQAFFMKKAIEQENLKDALKYGSNMICELRTSDLAPRFYYELYMLIFQELQHLTAFFADKARHGRKLTELYESVQHAGNILPRLYLLVTVGVAYIQSGEAPGGEILRDMAELCKGIQHPVRGLFLRYYLLQMTKDKLQLVIDESNGFAGLSEVCEFILSNFSETTRLWIRIAGNATRDRVRKDRERHDLRILVGASLVRLSQLEGVSRSFYASEILPKILSQVIETKDALAQQYLLDCTVQVFPDDFHLGSLEALLACCSNTQKAVDLRPVLVNLMTRLKTFLTLNDDPAEGIQDTTAVFGLFRVHLEKIIHRTAAVEEAGEEVPLTNTMVVESTSDLAAKTCGSMLELLQAFLGFTIALGNTGLLSQISLVHGMALATLDKYQESLAGIPRVDDSDDEDKNQAWLDPLIELVETTLSAVPLGTALELSQFGSLLSAVPRECINRVSLAMIGAVLEKNEQVFFDEGTLTRFFGIIDGLLHDEASHVVEETVRVCQMVYLFPSFEMLNTMRSYFGRGGPERLSLTLPTILSRAQELLKQSSVSKKKIFQFIHNTCSALIPVNPEMAFHFWLSSATLADTYLMEPIAHEFFTQAILTFEEELVDSKIQPVAFLQLVNTLFATKNMSIENYELLATKITQHGAKMLKKIEQARSVLAAAHLFWSPTLKDPKRVLECLQRGLKIADIATQAAPAGSVLFVECLNQYLYFLQAEMPTISNAHVSNLVALCREHTAFADNADAKEYLQQTMVFIEVEGISLI